MKHFCTIFSFSLILNLSVAKNSTLTLTAAFRDVINSLYIKPQVSFDIILYKATSLKIFDIVDGIGSELTGKILRTSEPFNVTESAIIFTQNETTLSEILNKT